MEKNKIYNVKNDVLSDEDDTADVKSGKDQSQDDTTMTENLDSEPGGLKAHNFQNIFVMKKQFRMLK